ncbi:hypothetical protein [Nocardia wallacei]|uniref:hypothetical protein n=1 Tax=Nocardia wallacei TaxID=480035 RepID=UPI0024538060|nr:hypothetical protein [Nocardia wallacei]
MPLPTQSEIFFRALNALDASRSGLSDARDWLNSDWPPDSPPLPDTAADARSTIRAKIAEAKALIDEAKGAAIEALDALEGRS